jgi:hypothetical protein
MSAGSLQQTQLWLDQQIRAYIRAGEGTTIPAEPQLDCSLSVHTIHFASAQS